MTKNSEEPTQIGFTHPGDTIIVADKFGDVFSYPLTPLPTSTPASTPPTEADTLASHENPSGGMLVLGHTSLLTAFLLSPEDTHIITADRDEHIRASRFPQGYSIESFCLGHKSILLPFPPPRSTLTLRRFVSAIHIPRDPTAHGILVSGGGDPVLKFIAVRRARRQRGYGSDGERKPPSRRWLARQRRREAKAAAGAEPPGDPTPEVEEAEVGDDGEGELDAGNDDESGDDASDAETTSTPGMEERPSVIVVQKIDTSKVDGRVVVVFSAVGATALFWFALPPDPAAVSGETLVVHTHDLGRPVVTFTPMAGSPDCLWVSVDAHWAVEGSLRRVLLSRKAASAVEVSPPPPLLSTLNGSSVIPATEREVSALQLYEALTSLPKNIDATHNPMIRDASESPATTTKATGKRSAKAAGKMRTRMALLQRGAETQEEPPMIELPHGFVGKHVIFSYPLTIQVWIAFPFDQVQQLAPSASWCESDV
ncbi:hypothetical protein EI94DRAFT_1800138 [Lactarius quietus]|nr:hypothetical protein EI94DRAFT_1800138 [Lactarius quietus]